MIENRQLEAFGMVIECSGFDRAAEVMGLTQSAVTHRVKQLEIYVGKPLLVRSNPPVPTEAGKPFYSHFKKIRLLEEDLQAETDGRLSGAPLSLGINASSLGSWFMPALGAIMKKSLVDIHIGEAKVVHFMLQQGSLAGCISIREKASRGCYSEYLGNMILRCVSTRDFKHRYFPRRMGKDDMKKAPALLFHSESLMMTTFQKSALGMTPFDVPTHYIPAQHDYIEMIGAGAAYGFIPESLFNNMQVDKGLIDLSPTAPIILPQYWHRWGIESDLLNFATDIIREQARIKLHKEE